MKRFLQKIAIWLYEKTDCREIHDNEFWRQHIMYAVPLKVNHKIIVMKIQEQVPDTDLTYVGSYHSDTKTFEKEEN